MKRCIASLLLVVIAISFCACEKTDNINIEDFSAEHSVMYKQSVYMAYYCEFKNGLLTVDKNTYKNSASSPSGVTLDETETVTYRYTLEGDNYITVDGIKYQYRAYKAGEYAYYIEFTEPFLGIAKKWKG